MTNPREQPCICTVTGYGYVDNPRCRRHHPSPEHISSRDCWCRPEVEVQPNGGRVYIHNERDPQEQADEWTEADARRFEYLSHNYAKAVRDETYPQEVNSELADLERRRPRPDPHEQADKTAGEKWKVRQELQDGEKAYVVYGGEQEFWMMQSPLGSQALADYLNQLEAENAALKAALDAMPTCTPYHYSGEEYCQHGFRPKHCPIALARAALGGSHGDART